MSPDDPFADRDPSDPQSWNLYSYVRNNPLTNTDPTGNACVGGVDDDRGGETCAQVDAADAEYARQGKASVTVTAQPSGQFDPGSLAAGVFGPQSASTWNNAAGTVNAAGQIEMSIMAPWAGPAADCMSGGSKVGCAANMALSILPEVGELRSGGKVLKEMNLLGKKGAEIIQKTGGAAEAGKEYGALKGVEHIQGDVRIKTLEDGTTVTLRGSSGGQPTVSIQHTGGGVTKIRY